MDAFLKVKNKGHNIFLRNHFHFENDKTADFIIIWFQEDILYELLRGRQCFQSKEKLNSKILSTLGSQGKLFNCCAVLIEQEVVRLPLFCTVYLN